MKRAKLKVVWGGGGEGGGWFCFGVLGFCLFWVFVLLLVLGFFTSGNKVNRFKTA